MFKKTILLVAVLITSFLSQTYAQRLAQDNITNTLSAPSPNASHASFGESVSVNLYTGQLQAGFKLFEYSNKSSGLKHEINLSYQGGGIRADDIASDVGTGWQLSTGGVITRDIRGLPDDDNEGYYQNATPVANAYDSSAYSEVVNGMYDMEADMYHYSAGEYSGDFVMGKDGAIVTIPASNVKIEMVTSPYNPGTTALDSCHSIKYKITLPDGRKYFYDSYDCSRVNFNANRFGYASSTWYLTMIISSFDRDTIKFSYTPTVQEFTAGLSVVNYSSTDNPSEYSRIKFDTAKLRDLKISQINYPDGKQINFQYSAFNRVDLKTDQALEKISISNNLTASGYSVAFNHSYQKHDNLPPYQDVIPYQDYTGTTTGSKEEVVFRLILDGFKMVSGTESLPGYSFAYFPMSYKRCDSYAGTDHWGFNRGNGGRIPSADQDNKQPALAYTVSSSLKQIGLPTGGSTNIEYELHTTRSFPGPVNLIYSIDSLAFQSNYNSWYDADYGFPANTLVNVIAPPSIPSAKVFHRITITPNEWPNLPSNAILKFRIGKRINNANNLPYSGYHQEDFLSVDFTNVTTKTIEFLADKGDTMSFYIYSATSGAYSTNPVFLLNWKIYSTTHDTAISTKLVGGLRVKKLVRTDSTYQNNQAVTEYKYVVSSGIGSSGIMVNEAAYNSSYSEVYNPSPGNPNHPEAPYGLPIDLNQYDLVSYYARPSATYGYVGIYEVTTGAPQNTLVYTQGSPVGYERVEQYDGTSDHYKSKTVYYFKTRNDIGIPDSLNSNTFPYSPIPTIDFAVGLTLKTEEYSASNILMKTTTNTYSTQLKLLNNANFKNLRVGLIKHPDNSKLSFKDNYYYPITGKVFPAQTTQTEYYANGDSSVHTTETIYDTAKLVPKVIATTDAKGESVQTFYYYPFDFSVGGAVAQLNTQGLIYAPIRTETWKGQSSTSRIINAAVSTFQQLADGSIKQDASYGLTIKEPILWSNWNAYSNTQLLDNTQYFTKIAQMDSYDSKGNTIQVTSSSITNSTIFDYNQSIPVAQVSNAAIPDIAYTSFEAEGTGGWSDDGGNSIDSGGITGVKLCSLSSSGFSKSGLDVAKSYFITVWADRTPPQISLLSGGTMISNSIASDEHLGWTLYRSEFTNAPTVSVTAPTGHVRIDELRLYPRGAAMSTTTNDPLFGVTSACDPSNRIVYYEYDSFGRLKYQRDMNNNILKVYEYKIGQPQN